MLLVERQRLLVVRQRLAITSEQQIPAAYIAQSICFPSCKTDRTMNRERLLIGVKRPPKVAQLVVAETEIVECGAFNLTVSDSPSDSERF